MARRCARAMLSSRKCEMMTEKRNSMISTAPPAGRKSVSGGIGQSDQVAKSVEQRVHQRENQHGGGGQQPGHGILHANVRPAHADQDGDEQDDADNCGDVQEAVHLSSSAAAAWPAVEAAIEFQYVDKNP